MFSTHLFTFLIHFPIGATKAPFNRGPLPVLGRPGGVRHARQGRVQDPPRGAAAGHPSLLNRIRRLLGRIGFVQ